MQSYSDIYKTLPLSSASYLSARSTATCSMFILISTSVALTLESSPYNLLACHKNSNVMSPYASLDCWSAYSSRSTADIITYTPVPPATSISEVFLPGAIFDTK